MAQATPDIGAWQGLRWQKRRVAQRRGQGGVVGLERLGAFLAALCEWYPKRRTFPKSRMSG